MTHKARPNWDKVNVPAAMTDLIEQYLQTDIAKQRGLKNKSDVATEGIKILLERDGMYTRRPRFQHLNMYEDHVKVIDNDLGRIASVYFRRRKIFCDLCETDECIHADFALSIPDVVNILREKGFPLPRSRTAQKNST
jgi:hypothetical protein